VNLKRKTMLLSLTLSLMASTETLAQSQAAGRDPLSGSVKLCANVANPLTGRFLRQAYIPIEDVSARNTANGFGVSRMSRGPCETKIVATSDTHKIVTTFSTITGEVISDVLSELPGQALR